jgi:hypothetical protein
MEKIQLWQIRFLVCLLFTLVGGCATTNDQAYYGNSEAYNNLPLYHGAPPFSASYNQSRYVAMLPERVSYGEKVIVIDPRLYAWGAYDSKGNLVRGGIANAGANFCPDKGGSCRTSSGSFRIYSLGGVDCVSKTYPLPRGGSLMPYCMFFHGGESLHGTPDPMLVDANTSHGCIHMRIPDAEWLRYNFAQVGTKVVVLPY